MARRDRGMASQRRYDRRVARYYRKHPPLFGKSTGLVVVLAVGLGAWLLFKPSGQ